MNKQRTRVAITCGSEGGERRPQLRRLAVPVSSRICAGKSTQLPVPIFLSMKQVTGIRKKYGLTIAIGNKPCQSQNPSLPWSMSLCRDTVGWRLAQTHCSRNFRTNCMYLKRPLSHYLQAHVRWHCSRDFRRSKNTRGYFGASRWWENLRQQSHRPVGVRNQLSFRQCCIKLRQSGHRFARRRIQL